MLRNSSTYFLIRVLILTEFAQFFKGEVERKKNDSRNALSCYIKGIGMNCKHYGLNVTLYSKRADLHSFLGEFTRLFLFQFSLVKFTNF
jgi:hypothetical protein